MKAEKSRAPLQLPLLTICEIVKIQQVIPMVREKGCDLVEIALTVIDWNEKDLCVDESNVSLVEQACRSTESFGLSSLDVELQDIDVLDSFTLAKVIERNAVDLN